MSQIFCFISLKTEHLLSFFGQLVKQNMTFEEVHVGSGKPCWAFITILLAFMQKKVCTLIDNESNQWLQPK